MMLAAGLMVSNGNAEGITSKKCDESLKGNKHISQYMEDKFENFFVLVNFFPITDIPKKILQLCNQTFQSQIKIICSLVDFAQQDMPMLY
jgi:hypothetical protein